MAAERPRRRITQPCLEYNGGLLHKEELMLRRAMYASLVESKKPSPSKLSNHKSTTSSDTASSNGSHDSSIVNSMEEVIMSKPCITPDVFDNNNSASESGQCNTGQSTELHHPFLGDSTIKKKLKMSKEPSKLLNYVIKKKKEKGMNSRAFFRTSSPTKFPGNGSGTGSSSTLNGKSKKKKKRQRGALAVFVAMNKSAGGKINKDCISEPEKELLLKAKRKRRRKKKGFETQMCSKADGTNAGSDESPVKKSRKEEKNRPGKVVHAQRKFAKSHPRSPASIRLQEERNLLSSSCTRAKTEDFLTFLCLRNNPVLPKELEIFNNPCLPMSPLSDEEENNSSPPSPTQSQSSMSNSSNLSSTIQKSFSDSPVPSVDSPAMGEGPSWESGVVRMYADGPKGLAGSGKEQKKYDELLPSDEADDPRESTKSVTPPLAFRVSSRPTNWTSYRAKDKQLPRPIPKPFAVKPSLTGASTNRTSFSPTGISNTGDSAIHPPPPPLHPAESSSCSPPPPPLLYIPAAAQRVTHLHGPPTLQRFPSTSPTREQENDERSEQQRLSIERNNGPPPLKRFPPIVIDLENSEEDKDSAKSSSRELPPTQINSSEFRPLSSWSPSKNEVKVAAPVAVATSSRSSSSLSDLTKISQTETEAEGGVCRWRNKEMPLLRRHSSATQDAVCFEELVNASGRLRPVNTRSSPPQLQRVPIPADTGIQRQLGRLESSSSLLKTSGGLSETSGSRCEISGSQSKASGGQFETSSSRAESSVGRFEPYGRQPESSGNQFNASGARLQTSGSRFDASCSRLSPNFRPQPPRLVRHTITTPVHPEANHRVTSLNNDMSTSGDSNQLRSSPLAFSPRGSPQAFQEQNYVRPIPIAEVPLSARRLSPVFIPSKHKSTYVFSNRQTFLPPEKEPRPLQVSSLVMPSKNGVTVIPNRGEVSSKRFESVANSNRLDERQPFVRNAPPSIQSQYTDSYPSSFIHRPHENSSRQFGDSSSRSNRIPSPRSDLLSRLSDEPVNSSCMSRVSVPFPGSSSTGEQPMAIRSNVRHAENTFDSFPPTWSHLESPYSEQSIAWRNSPPKPYTFSVNLPHSEGSRSNSSTPTLEGYSLAPIQSCDQRHISVIECASLNQGESLNRQSELRVGGHENSRTYHLPTAFHEGISRPDSRTNVFSNESTLAETSAREHLMQKSYINDCSTPPLLRRIELPAKPRSSNSPSLNRDNPSPLFRHDELHANPPSSNSPSLKGKKSGSDLVVAGNITDPKTSCNSPKIVGKKTLGSKHKHTICPSLDKTNGSPIFYPSEEEFKDPAAYIKRIRQEAEKFGVCVIVPPESWKPEFQISDNVRFNSERQLIHRLQDRWGPVEEELACIKKHLDQQSISLVPMPQIGGYELDLPQFSRVVKQFGGLQKVIDSKKWTKVADLLRIPRAAQDRIGKLQDIYCKYLLSYDLLPQEEKDELLRLVQSERESKEQDTDSWSVKGRNLSLVPFQRLARNVHAHFFKNPPSANDVEREFWKIVHDRESFVSVHRGIVDTNQEHSCFPTDKGDPYSKLGWNLNVLPHLPGSVLKHLGYVQDITIPWLQLDMLFSVKSWQAHPLALYTVDYLHSGAEKIWYSVPVRERKKLASLFEQEDDEAAETSLERKMVSPSSLTDSGVTVTRVVQKQGQFVIVFPEAYHSSISCGYSVSEAVNFAPPDWLLLGSKRYKDLKDSSWWSEFAYDRLLLGIAQELTDETQEVVLCLLAELQIIRDEEKLFMAELLELGLIEMVDKERKSSGSLGGKKGKKSHSNWTQPDSSCVLFCEECDKPCFLSAVTGEDEPQVLCLKHAVKHIRDKASPKGFRILSRYDTDRLDQLVSKVQEKLKKHEAPPN